MLTWRDSGIGYIYVKSRPMKENAKENEKESLVLPHDQRITWLLWSAYNTINAMFEEHMGYERLHHFWLLAPLAENGPHIQKDLAKQLRVKESAMSQFIDKLEARGWVTRAVSVDRRYRFVELTESGKKRAAELNEMFMAAQREIEKQFSPDEWRHGLRFLWYLAHPE